MPSGAHADPHVVFARERHGRRDVGRIRCLDDNVGVPLRLASIAHRPESRGLVTDHAAGERSALEVARERGEVIRDAVPLVALNLCLSHGASVEGLISCGNEHTVKWARAGLHRVIRLFRNQSAVRA